MQNGKTTTIVIGIGNPCRRDDGIGILVARRLKASRFESAVVLEASGEGAALIEMWDGANKVVIIDATFSGASPGTIRRIDVQQQSIPADFIHHSSHAFGVAEAIELARVIGRLPAQCIVFGVEGLGFGAGVRLSPALDQVVDQVINAVVNECIAVEGNLP